MSWIYISQGIQLYIVNSSPNQPFSRCMTFEDNFKEKERETENGGWGRRVCKKMEKMVALVREREKETNLRIVTNVR